MGDMDGQHGLLWELGDDFRLHFRQQLLVHLVGHLQHDGSALIFELLLPRISHDELEKPLRTAIVATGY